MKPRFPLRLKITLLAALNLVVLGVILLIFLRLQLRMEFESFLMAGVRERVQSIARDLSTELGSTSARDLDAVLARYSEAYDVMFLLRNNEGARIAGPDIALPEHVVQRLRRFRPPPGGGVGPAPLLGPSPFPPFLVVTDSEYQYWLGTRIGFLDFESGEATRATLLLASRDFWTNSFFFQTRPWLILGAIALLASLLCWLPLISGLTSSVTQMMKATGAVAEGAFDVQVKTTRQDELGSLARSINQMAARLASYVQGQKRFLGDVAHELRTPLGRMQIALGILERDAQPKQAELIQDLKEEVDLMSGLTGELLAYARAETMRTNVHLSDVKLLDVVQRAIDVEAGTGTDISVDVSPELKVKADPECIFRAISNLVRNAIRYAGDKGPITVSATLEGDRVRLTVADSGSGVPEAELDRIFAPFYRLDASRDRRSGGTGLGLAIVRTCVQACGGSVEARNRKPEGFEVIIHLLAAIY